MIGEAGRCPAVVGERDAVLGRRSQRWLGTLGVVLGLRVAAVVWGASDVGMPAAGHFNYESPHSNPLALLPDGSLLYVANTPADTVDVIDTASHAVVARVRVGIDPVGVAVRPDGKEVWVTNHISDSVSVIDADLDSVTRHQVLATI